MSRLIWLLVAGLSTITSLIGLLWLLAAAMQDPHGRRALSLAEAFDQIANAAVGGDPDMTLSAHAGREVQTGKRWACWICRLLDQLDPDHCAKSWAAFQHSQASK
jgi:hypothetical protein